MIKLGQKAIEIAEESLEKLTRALKEKENQQEILRQKSVDAEFTVAELLNAISKVKSVYQVDFSYIYETDDTNEDYTEVTGIDNYRIEFSMDEEISEGTLEFISEWIDIDVSLYIPREHNAQVQLNLDELYESN